MDVPCGNLCSVIGCFNYSTENIYSKVLYPQDLAQVSNSSILVPPQLYPLVFIYVDFLDSGIHCQVLIFPFPQILLNKNRR